MSSISSKNKIVSGNTQELVKIHEQNILPELKNSITSKKNQMERKTRHTFMEILVENLAETTRISSKIEGDF